MNRIVKSSVVTAVLAAVTITALPAAAGERWRDRDHRRHAMVERNSGADMLAAGAIGVAAGAILGGVIANTQAQPVYREPAYRHPQTFPRPSPDRHYFPPAPRYYEAEPIRYVAPEPWTRDWYRYCSDRYRSFNPDSGTFLGYDGVRRFCEAN